MAIRRDRRQGQPGYPPLVMLRVLLLQNWYGLSDPELEIALADRLSFRRFCGLSLQDETPDNAPEPPTRIAPRNGPQRQSSRPIL